MIINIDLWYTLLFFKMYILGIYNTHNATCALLKDGKVLSSTSEERFSGVKNHYGFPKQAIDYCLKEAGIKSEELDLVAIPYKYGAPMHSFRKDEKDAMLSFLIVIYKVVGLIRKIWGEITFKFPQLLPIGQFMFRAATLMVEKIHMVRERRAVAEYLNIPAEKIVSFDHHLCHAASAYFASSFNQQKCLVLTIDGEGDFCSSSVSIFEGKKYKVLAKTSRESSLGYIYARLTQSLGMKDNEHEYKVMGLAPYARSEDVNRVYDLVKDIIYFDPRNPLVFKTRFNTLDTDKFIKRKLSKVRFDLLASLFQRLLEEKITQWVEASIKKTKLNVVALAGGVIMNIKVNQKIAELKSVKELFIMPSASDESTPIGACYLGFLMLNAGKYLKEATIRDIYWGPQFSDSQTLKFIRNKKIDKKYKVKKFKDIESQVAKLLAQGKIVARCSGRMEFGARALGNRSILANPSNPQIIRTINDQIKGRDFWMPFAPTILWERMNDYVINPKRFHSPYMMIGFNSTELARKQLVAALHPYDLTLRPQLLEENYNPLYYKIIKEFEKLTGIGGVLNTSFNLHGFPIVKGPEEAILTFENSDLEYLVLENYLISKK